MSQATNYQAQVIQNLERGQIRKTRSTDYSKRQKRDFEFFQKGVNLGAQMMQTRILNSTAGLTYEEIPVEEATSLLAADGDADVADLAMENGYDLGESESTPS